MGLGIGLLLHPGGKNHVVRGFALSLHVQRDLGLRVYKGWRFAVTMSNFKQHLTGSYESPPSPVLFPGSKRWQVYKELQLGIYCQRTSKYGYIRLEGNPEGPSVQT